MASFLKELLGVFCKYDSKSGHDQIMFLKTNSEKKQKIR